jgi:hypothetical protein
MSGNKLLEKFADRVALSDEPEALSDDVVDDLGAFGYVRGGLHDRSIMLELRRRCGNILAIGYGYVDRIEFDPSEGITVHCGSRSILIKGKNFDKEVRPQVSLFRGLTRNKIIWVAEADQGVRLKAGENEVVVDAIEWS